MSPAAQAAIRPADDAVLPHGDVQAEFDRAADSLYRYFVVRTGGDVHLADDLMQQLWLAARRGVAPSGGQCEFWLRAVARNLVRTHWRKIAGRPKTTPLADLSIASALAERLATQPIAAEMLERGEVRDQLWLAITELPAEHQELIVAHYFQGRSQVELALEAGVTPRAIEGRLYRARLALRETLQKLS